MANTLGDTLHRLEDLLSIFPHGLHTVNDNSELIYIDRENNVNLR